MIFSGNSAVGSFTAQTVVTPGLTYRCLDDYASFFFLADTALMRSTILTSLTEKLYPTIVIMLCLLVTVKTVGPLSFIGYSK